MNFILTNILIAFLCFAFWSPTSNAKNRRTEYSSGYGKKKSRKNARGHKKTNRYGRYGLGLTSKKSTNYEGMHSYVLKLSGSQSFNKESNKNMHEMDDKEQQFSPMASAMFGYGLTRSLSLDLMAMYMFDMGIMDPSAGFSYKHQINRRLRSVSSINASFPASEMSQDMDKMTTISASTGILLASSRRLSTFFSIKGSYSLYNSPNDKHVGSMAAMGENHSSHAHSDSNDSMSESGNMNSNMNSNMNGSENMTGTMNSSNNMNMESMDMASMVMKRETNRFGGDLGFNYNLVRRWQTRTFLDMNLISYDDSSNEWLTTLTVVELSYAMGGFMDMGTSTMPMGAAAFTNLNLTSQNENFEAPTSPVLIVGIAYGGM